MSIALNSFGLEDDEEEEEEEQAGYKNCSDHQTHEKRAHVSNILIYVNLKKIAI